MNIENFKKEFKVYCKTVENVKALEFIKQYVFNSILNLETFIDDNLGDIDLDNNMQVIEEARRLSKVLGYYSELAEMIDEFEVRKVWKVVDGFSEYDIVDIFDTILSQCCGSLCYEYGIDLSSNEFLSDEQLDNERWYTDLCNLVDKYNI